MRTYPIALSGLNNYEAVVVGGGKVAARKVRGLLEAGARIKVISPQLVSELEALQVNGAITTLRRLYQPGDLEGAFLVIAATGEPGVNEAVWQEAQARGCLINTVDDPQRSNFITPAVVRRGEITLAISTGGASPALARRLRERLEAEIGPEYGLFADLLAELRPEILSRFPAGEARLQAALRLVDSDLLKIIRSQGLASARLQALALLGEEPAFRIEQVSGEE